MYVLDRRWVTDNMGVGYYASNAVRTYGYARTTASAVSEITEYGEANEHQEWWHHCHAKYGEANEHRERWHHCHVRIGVHTDCGREKICACVPENITMTDEDSPVQFKYTGAHHGYVVGVATHRNITQYECIVNYVILQLHGSGCENAIAQRDDRSTVCYLKYTLVWILCAFTDWIKGAAWTPERQRPWAGVTY